MWSVVCAQGSLCRLCALPGQRQCQLRAQGHRGAGSSPACTPAHRAQSPAHLPCHTAPANSSCTGSISQGTAAGLGHTVGRRSLTSASFPAPLRAQQRRMCSLCSKLPLPRLEMRASLWRGLLPRGDAGLAPQGVPKVRAPSRQTSWLKPRLLGRAVSCASEGAGAAGGPSLVAPSRELGAGAQHAPLQQCGSQTGAHVQRRGPLQLVIAKVTS